MADDRADAMLGLRALAHADVRSPTDGILARVPTDGKAEEVTMEGSGACFSERKADCGSADTGQSALDGGSKAGAARGRDTPTTQAAGRLALQRRPKMSKHGLWRSWISYQP